MVVLESWTRVRASASLRRMNWPALLALAIALLVTASARADVIVSTLGGEGGLGACISTGLLGGDCPAIATASWSQSSTYTGVSISASLFDAFSVAGTINAFLTDSIGAGTTVANEIASANVAYPVDIFGQLTLFSGLTLGPGTYYLTLHTSETADWLYGYAGVMVAPGVSHLGDSKATCCAGYIPSSNPTFPLSQMLSYAVTGTPAPAEVPEPGTAGLLGAGVVLLGLLRRGVR